MTTQHITQEQRERYEAWYKRILRRAEFVARDLSNRPEAREERVQAIVALTWQLYLDACRAGAKVYPSSLVRFACQRLKVGRRLERYGVGKRDITDRCHRLTDLELKMRFQGSEKDTDGTATRPIERLPGKPAENPAVIATFNLDMERILATFSEDTRAMAVGLIDGNAPYHLQRFAGDALPYRVRDILQAYVLRYVTS